MGKTFINGNKIQMGFALSAYIDDNKKNAEEEYDSRIGNYNELRPAIKFKNLNNIVERNFNKYDEDANGCDCLECEVDKGAEVEIFVDGELVYGPVKGGSNIMIL